MAFWTYILRCADGRYYTGHTDNLEVRIPQHQAGGYCGFTSARRPVELVWSSEFPTRIEALEAEQRIKKWSQAKKKALIGGNWQLLSHLALPPKERETRSPFVSSEVETRRTEPFCTGLSTSLETNGNWATGNHESVRVERSRDTLSQPPPASGRGLE